jgi:hypothetical protein
MAESPPLSISPGALPGRKNKDNIQNLPYGGTFRRAYRMGARFNYKLRERTAP